MEGQAAAGGSGGGNGGSGAQGWGGSGGLGGSRSGGGAGGVGGGVAAAHGGNAAGSGAAAGQGGAFNGNGAAAEGFVVKFQSDIRVPAAAKPWFLSHDCDGQETVPRVLYGRRQDGSVTPHSVTLHLDSEVVPDRHQIPARAPGRAQGQHGEAYAGGGGCGWRWSSGSGRHGCGGGEGGGGAAAAAAAPGAMPAEACPHASTTWYVQAVCCIVTYAWPVNVWVIYCALCGLPLVLMAQGASACIRAQGQLPDGRPLLRMGAKQAAGVDATLQRITPLTCVFVLRHYCDTYK